MLACLPNLRLNSYLCRFCLAYFYTLALFHCRAHSCLNVSNSFLCHANICQICLMLKEYQLICLDNFLTGIIIFSWYLMMFWKVRIFKRNIFTFIQITGVAVLLVFKSIALVSFIFPVILVLLVVLRKHVFTKFFTSRELEQVKNKSWNHL